MIKIILLKGKLKHTYNSISLKFWVNFWKQVSISHMNLIHISADISIKLNIWIFGTFSLSGHKYFQKFCFCTGFAHQQYIFTMGIPWGRKSLPPVFDSPILVQEEFALKPQSFIYPPPTGLPYPRTAISKHNKHVLRIQWSTIIPILLSY